MHMHPFYREGSSTLFFRMGISVDFPAAHRPGYMAVYDRRLSRLESARFNG